MRLFKNRYRGFRVEQEAERLHVWKGWSIVYSDYSKRHPVERARLAKEWIDSIHEAKEVFDK